MIKISSKISIIIATFNRGHLIEGMLDSVLNQSFKNWECLIIDDGSTDNTTKILQPYLQNDHRLKYFKRSQDHQRGLPGCRNYGLDLAKGDYIIFYDDDDMVHPDNLQICSDLIFDNELYFCRYEKKPFKGNLKPEALKDNVSFNSKIVDIKDLESIVSGKLPFASCTVLWKKECFEYNKFREELLYAEEWECYTRILSTGIKGISIDKVLYYNRKHPNSNTGQFYNDDPVRKASNLMAIKLVISNLSKKELLSPNLVKFFIRTGFLLKEIGVLKDVLEYSNAGPLKRMKYLWGFRIYPVLKPFFNLKAKLTK